MENKQNKLPPIIWLKVTDFMHGWLQHELGGQLRIRDQRVVSVQDLPGSRDILRLMETEEDSMMKNPVNLSMSSTKKNCIDAGLALNDGTVEKLCGVTKEGMKLFAPIECPPRCINKDGMVRPWTESTNLGKRQASELMALLRNEFWNAVSHFAEKYAQEHEGEKYAQVNMIESFCQETKTPDMFAETIRREWQRRCKRKRS